MNKYLRNTNKVLLAAIAFIMLASMQPVAAQKKKAGDDDRRKEWMTDMRNFKHDFYKKSLGLTREQEATFFKSLDQMDDELIRIGEETRQLENKINADANATDTEMESAARTLFEQKRKEADVELKYFEEFKTTLTKRQLLKLKETERRFNRQLISHHAKGKKQAKD